MFVAFPPSWDLNSPCTFYFPDGNKKKIKEIVLKNVTDKEKLKKLAKSYEQRYDQVSGKSLFHGLIFQSIETQGMGIILFVKDALWVGFTAVLNQGTVTRNYYYELVLVFTKRVRNDGGFLGWRIFPWSFATSKENNEKSS